MLANLPQIGSDCDHRGKVGDVKMKILAYTPSLERNGSWRCCSACSFRPLGAQSKGQVRRPSGWSGAPKEPLGRRFYEKVSGIDIPALIHRACASGVRA